MTPRELMRLASGLLLTLGAGLLFSGLWGHLLVEKGEAAPAVSGVLIFVGVGIGLAGFWSLVLGEGRGQ